MKTKLLLFIVLLCGFANAQVTNGLLHEFKFNNSYSNEANTSTFNSAAGITFVADRNGNANSAINIANTSTTATVAGLPYGNLVARTVTFWAKFNTLTNADSNVYSYGLSSFFNTGVVTAGAIGALGPGGNHAVFLTNTVNTWHHYAFVYDGTNSIIYKDGILLGTLARNWNVQNNADLFRLGANQAGTAALNASLDDLKMYNRALSAAEVSLLSNATIPSAIAEYSFDNTYNNINGSNPFTANTGTSFVTGRDGVTANGALNIVNSGSTAIIPNLPYGASPRTVSVWVKVNQFNSSGFNFIYHYGANGAGNGLFLSSGTITHFVLSPTNHGAGATTLINTWYHLVVVYDGTNSKIFRNGALIESVPRTINTGVGTGASTNLFRLGLSESGVTGYFSGAIDDLKIYNYELSANEVSSLFNNNSLNAAPIISNITAVTNVSTASITANIATNISATTTVLNYGTSSTALTNQVAGPTLNSTGLAAYPITGLAPSTQYFYQVVATNSAGAATSAVLNFTTQSAPETIAEYSFNQTLNNLQGNTPFNTLGTNTYGIDRNGNANAALSMQNGSRTASIANLPIGNASRTVSLWIKPEQISASDQIVFYYGTQSANAAYGFSFTASTINNFGWANDLIGNVTLAANVWRHVVCTYNSSGQATIYLNGTSLFSASKPAWNTASTGFILTGFNGLVDDLKIYNYALSQAQITSLFTNNTLTSQNFNQNNLEVSLYPNPATNVLNIEMTNEVKSVEIYNIQGQKVMTANQKQINVSPLASGIYIVKVTDSLDALATKRIIVNSK